MYPSIRGFRVDNSDSEALATVFSEGEVPQLVIHRTKFQWLWIREGEVSVVVDSEGKVRELWIIIFHIVICKKHGIVVQ